MEFYERMRELRKEHGETQAQAAAAAGMTDRQYQRFETGKQKPGVDSLLALADHFGVSMDYLAGRTDAREGNRGTRPPAGPEHRIILAAEVEAPDTVEPLLRRVISAALEAEGMDLPCEINVLLTDDEGIHQVNLDMRGVDRPTDVLSFPMFDLSPGEKPGEEHEDPDTGLVPLGDMCISLERAAAQGAEATKQYVSKFGRAKSYGTKTIGTPDAGAVSMSWFFQGLARE